MSSSAPGPSLWTGPREEPRRYRVDLENGTLAHVGDGGEGLVYRAVCMRAGIAYEVALKMHTSLALTDFDTVNRRAQILRTVHHPHVMHLVDAFVGTALVDDDTPTDADFSVIYTAAEWIPGEPLAIALGLVGPVPAMRWVTDLARAAAYLHSFQRADAPDGLVHRDIKPTNVRITADGRAVLIDLGIARPLGSGDMTRGAGTYLWQAPEILGAPGTPGPASDAWGIGAVAFWILTGDAPQFDAAPVARRRLEEQARQAGFADPVGLARHIARLLELHPDRRPRDLLRWSHDLDDILAGKRPHRWSTAAVEGLIRHSRLAVGALAVIVALAVAVTTIAIYVGSRHAQNVAQAGELAAESVSIMPHDAILGSLLSVEASQLTSTTETRNAAIDALEQPLTTVLGAGHPVASVAVSPDRRTVATGDGAGHVVLWTASTGVRIGRPLSDGSAITTLAFNIDGTALATGDSAGTVVVWQTAPEKRLETLQSGGGAVTSLAFNPTGTILAAGDRGGTVDLWQTATWLPAGSPLLDGSSVNGLAFSPNGALLVSGDSNASIVRRSTATWAAIGPPLSDNSPVMSVAFNHDGTTIATGDAGTYVVLWDAATGTRIGNPLSCGSPVTTVAFSPDGQTLASGIDGGSVILWDTSHLHGQAIAAPTQIPLSLGNGSPVTSVAFSPNGATVLAGDTSGKALLWKVRTSQNALHIGGVVRSVAFSRHGHLLGAGTDVGNVQLWSTANGTPRNLPGQKAVVWGVAFSPSGKLFVTGDNHNELKVWNTANGKEVGGPLDAGSFVYSVAFSPNGKFFADGAVKNGVRLWSTATRSRIGPRLFSGHPIRSVAFSPDSAIIAAAGNAGRVLLWNTTTGQQIGRPLVDGSKINSIAFSPDGRLLATGDDAGNVRIWNIKSGTESALAIVDHREVESVAFSPNGKTLAEGDAAGDLVAWDVASNTEIGTPIVDPPAIDSVAFSPNGATLAAGAGNGYVFLYPSASLSATTEVLDQQLCRKMRGNLTPAQWHQYLPGSSSHKVCPAYP